MNDFDWVPYLVRIWGALVLRLVSDAFDGHAKVISILILKHRESKPKLTRGIFCLSSKNLCCVYDWSDFCFGLLIPGLSLGVIAYGWALSLPRFGCHLLPGSFKTHSRFGFTSPIIWLYLDIQQG